MYRNFSIKSFIFCGTAVSIYSTSLSFQASGGGSDVPESAVGGASTSSPQPSSSTSAFRLPAVDVKLSAMSRNVEVEIHDAVGPNEIRSGAPTSVVTQPEDPFTRGRVNPVSNPDDLGSSASSTFSFRSDSSGNDQSDDVTGGPARYPRRAKAIDRLDRHRGKEKSPTLRRFVQKLD